MKLRWLRPFVVLTAALIVLISNMVCRRPVLESLWWLLLTIIVFYIIGSIGTRIIRRTMESAAKKKAEEKAAAEKPKATDEASSDEAGEEQAG